MLKLFVAAELRAHEAMVTAADAVRSRRAQRGLTLVEYVLGASFVAAILFVIRRPLIDIAETQMTRIQNSLAS